MFRDLEKRIGSNEELVMRGRHARQCRANEAARDLLNDAIKKHPGTNPSITACLPGV
ncbi:MAG: hypothetical protein IPP33_10575 [Flavobacteriales bacterium]|nr:hypothetical protein [Flavobacteriales bacterium]